MGVENCQAPCLAGKNNLMSLFQLRCWLHDSGLFRRDSPLLSGLVVDIKTSASTDIDILSFCRHHQANYTVSRLKFCLKLSSALVLHTSLVFTY